MILDDLAGSCRSEGGDDDGSRCLQRNFSLVMKASTRHFMEPGTGSYVMEQGQGIAGIRLVGLASILYRYLVVLHLLYNTRMLM